MAEQKWLVEGEKVIDLDAITTLKVSLIAGQVDIVAHDEPTTRVEVHSTKGKALKIVCVDGHLEIDHPQLSWDNFIDVFRSFWGTARADVSVLVPREVALKLGVVSASALVSGLRSDSSISTVSGELTIDGLTGELQLNSVSGEITVRNHTGYINAHTISGEITMSGAVERLIADSVSGSVFLDVTGTPDSVRVNTVSGAVTTRLEPGVAAQYKINTVGGRIHLDDSEIRGVRGGFTSTYGSLDKTWVDFKANTVSGDISVLHSVTA
jgi:DUF4097 and DUF4098 domain-containing protein YvlB